MYKHTRLASWGSCMLIYSISYHRNTHTHARIYSALLCAVSHYGVRAETPCIEWQLVDGIWHPATLPLRLQEAQCHSALHGSSFFLKTTLSFCSLLSNIPGAPLMLPLHFFFHLILSRGNQRWQSNHRTGEGYGNEGIMSHSTENENNYIYSVLFNLRCAKS